MFAYCGNSPLNRIDATGDYFKHVNSFIGPVLGGFSNLGGTAVGVSTAMPSNGCDCLPIPFSWLLPQNSPIPETKQPTAQKQQRSFNYNGSKSEQYVNKRGWTDDMINEAITNGQKGTSINAANGATCSVYGYPGTDNQYVVIDDTTDSIVQVSNFNDSGWIVDGRIRWAP